MKKILITLMMAISFISFSKLEEIKKGILEGDTKYLVYTATWCGHCRAEYKHIQEIYTKYKKHFNILVFVSPDNSKKETEKFFTNKGYTFPVYYDEGAIFRDRIFQIKYYPTVIKIENGIPEIQNDLIFNIDNFYEINKDKINGKK